MGVATEHGFHRDFTKNITHDGSMVLDAKIWGIWMVNISIYTSTMDPMGKDESSLIFKPSRSI